MSDKYIYYSNNIQNNSLNSLLKLIRDNFKSIKQTKIDAGLKLSEFNNIDSMNLIQGTCYHGELSELTLNDYKVRDENIMGEVILQFTASDNFSLNVLPESNMEMRFENELEEFKKNQLYQLRFTTNNKANENNKYTLFGEVLRYETPVQQIVPVGDIQISYTSKDKVINVDWLKDNSDIISLLNYCEDGKNEFKNIKQTILDNPDMSFDPGQLRVTFNSGYKLNLSNMMKNVPFSTFKVVNLDGSRITSMENMFSMDDDSKHQSLYIDLLGIDNTNVISIYNVDGMFRGRKFTESEEIALNIVGGLNDGQLDYSKGIKFNSVTSMKDMFNNCITMNMMGIDKLINKIDTSKCHDFTGALSKCQFNDDIDFTNWRHSYNNNSITYEYMFDGSDMKTVHLSQLVNLLTLQNDITVNLNGMFKNTKLNDYSGLNLDFSKYLNCNWNFTNMFEECNISIPAIVKVNNALEINFDGTFKNAVANNDLDLSVFSKWSVGNSGQIICDNMFEGFPLYNAETFILFDKNSKVNIFGSTFECMFKDTGYGNPYEVELNLKTELNENDGTNDEVDADVVKEMLCDEISKISVPSYNKNNSNGDDINSYLYDILVAEYGEFKKGGKVAEL